MRRFHAPAKAGREEIDSYRRSFTQPALDLLAAGGFIGLTALFFMLTDMGSISLKGTLLFGALIFLSLLALANVSWSFGSSYTEIGPRHLHINRGYFRQRTLFLAHIRAVEKEGDLIRLLMVDGERVPVLTTAIVPEDRERFEESMTKIAENNRAQHPDWK